MLPTNGQVLRIALRLIEMATGDCEAHTCAADELARAVLDYPPVPLGIPDEQFENLRRSIWWLLRLLEGAGILARWEEEISDLRRKREPERYYLAPGSWGKLNQFQLLVEAQIEGASANADLREKLLWALTTEPEELEPVARWAQIESSPYEPEVLFMPASSYQRLALSRYDLVCAVVLARLGEIEEAIDLLLRSQMVFTNSRALWWMRATTEIATVGDGAMMTAIIARAGGGDVAAEEFLAEVERQELLADELGKFRVETSHIFDFRLDFAWLNAPFSPWEDLRQLVGPPTIGDVIDAIWAL